MNMMMAFSHFRALAPEQICIQDDHNVHPVFQRRWHQLQQQEKTNEAIHGCYTRATLGTRTRPHCLTLHKFHHFTVFAYNGMERAINFQQKDIRQMNATEMHFLDYKIIHI